MNLNIEGDTYQEAYDLLKKYDTFHSCFRYSH